VIELQDQEHPKFIAPLRVKPGSKVVLDWTSPRPSGVITKKRDAATCYAGQPTCSPPT